MSYSEDLKEFAQTYKYESITVGGGTFRYVLNGKQDGKTLVLLNGGMNTLEMWMEYVAPLSEDYQVLLFDYPQELRTNQELVAGFHMGAGVYSDRVEHSARRFRADLSPFQSNLSALLSTPFRKSSAYLSGDECNDRFNIPPESLFRAL